MSDHIVSHYGIHWDDQGVAFLMQGRGGTNAIGLRARPPFEVKLPDRSKHCNHQIPLANPVPNDFHWNFFVEMLGDELVQAMLPIPKAEGGSFYIKDPDGNLAQYLSMLSRMSSPIYPIVVPIWALTEDAILKELQVTNCQPLVVYGVEAKHSTILNKVAKASVYLPRRVVFAGASDVVVPSQMKRISTKISSDAFDFNDLQALPWESLGATTCRKFMRKEWPPQSNPRGSANVEAARSGRKARQA